jgi:hypothetical protein
MLDPLFYYKGEEIVASTFPLDLKLCPPWTKPKATIVPSPIFCKKTTTQKWFRV